MDDTDPQYDLDRCEGCRGGLIVAGEKEQAGGASLSLRALGTDSVSVSVLEP